MQDAQAWQADVDPALVKAVQLATAGFSLARFFHEPANSETIRRFTDPVMSATWPVRDPESVEALERLADVGAESRYEVGAEFHQLFGGHGVIRVRESDWLGTDPLPLVQELKKIYDDAGYVPVGAGAAPLDHIGIEISFVADRISKLAAQPELAEKITAFRAAHLDRFVEDVLSAVEQAADSELMRNVVILTRAALREMETFCAEVGETSRGE